MDVRGAGPGTLVWIFFFKNNESYIEKDTRRR